MLSKAKAYVLLEEFTDFVLVDETRDSIVVSVEKEYLKVINYELRKFRYQLVHKSVVGDTDSFTLVFMLRD
tara:strand:+ start:107 stop:319 length:213 start_codon:yes stop_codon:yes gene_type:complete